MLHSLISLKGDVAAKSNAPLGRAKVQRYTDGRGRESGREKSKSEAAGATGKLSLPKNFFLCISGRLTMSYSVVDTQSRVGVSCPGHAYG